MTQLLVLKGSAPSTQKISKIFNSISIQFNKHVFALSQKIIYANYSKLSKELKNSIKIKVGQAVFELLIQNQHFDCFDL